MINDETKRNLDDNNLISKPVKLINITVNHSLHTLFPISHTSFPIYTPSHHTRKLYKTFPIYTPSHHTFKLYTPFTFSILLHHIHKLLTQFPYTIHHLQTHHTILTIRSYSPYMYSLLLLAYYSLLSLDVLFGVSASNFTRSHWLCCVEEIIAEHIYFRFSSNTMFCIFQWKVWRYQKGNRMPQIEEGQTSQWPK
jgi:hypothetical protein